MNFARRTDCNQAEIVRALQRAGCAVFDTSRMGEGFPDLVASRAGQNFLLEVKAPGKKHDLTPAEWTFRDRWRGRYAVVTTPEEALEEVGL